MEASGKISRGSGIFCTTALFCMIERVPELKDSTNRLTNTMPANRWIAKCGTWPRPMMIPKTK